MSELIFWAGAGVSLIIGFLYFSDLGGSLLDALPFWYSLKDPGR